MMSIRTVTSKFNITTASSIFTRSIYLHTGKRIVGLKRDPNEVFVNPQGIKYELNEKNVAAIKSFLGDAYKIPDELALQVITHKSFGNGIKPHNEKLCALGSKLVNLFFAKHVIKTESTDKNRVINGKNLDVIGSDIAKELTFLKTAGIFANENKVNDVMFWKSSKSTLGFASSGARKVSGQMLYSLVGAVDFIHGKEIAENFINEKLVDGFEKISVESLKSIEEEEQEQPMPVAE